MTPAVMELDNPLPTRKAAELLAQAGWPPDRIAQELGISPAAANAVASFRQSTTTRSTGDRHLDERLHDVTSLAVDEAYREIQDPTSPHRIPLVKVLVGRAAASVGVSMEQGKLDELRTMFDKEATGVRNISAGLDAEVPDDADLDMPSVAELDA